MDDEVTVMFQIAKTLEGLDEDSRARVIRWAADKFGVDVGQPAAGEEAMGTGSETMFIGVDPEKVAAARAARDAAAGKSDGATDGARGAAPASAPPADEPPPDRDPEKPSFLDTSFRMYSGKKELKKAKDEGK